MLTTVLIARGSDFDAAEFVVRHQIPECNVWRTGQAGFKFEPYQDSGFNACVTEAVDWAKHVQDIAAYIERHSAALEELRDINLRVFLATGFTLSVGEVVMATRSFEPELLAKISALGLGLSVTAYLAGDQEVKR